MHGKSNGNGDVKKKKPKRKDGVVVSSGYSSANSRRSLSRKVSLSSWQQSDSVELLLYANPVILVKRTSLSIFFLLYFRFFCIAFIYLSLNMCPEPSRNHVVNICPFFPYVFYSHVCQCLLT